MDDASITPSESVSAPADSISSDDAMTREMSQTFDRVRAREDDPSAPSAQDTAPERAAEEAYTRRSTALDEAREALGPVAMPHAWSSDRSEAWSSLPRDVQSYIAERELSAAQKISELGQQAAKPAADIGSVLSQYGDAIPRDPSTGQPMA